MEDRYTYEKLIEKYGNPIIEYEIVPIEFLMSFEDESAEKPYKVAIFKNEKNILGFTVCATYQQKVNPDWYINAGSKWLIKYLIMDLKNTEDYNGKIIDKNMQLESDVANLQHKIYLLENEKQSDILINSQNLEIMNKQLDRIHELENLLTQRATDGEQ